MLQNYNFSTNPQEDGENSIAMNCHWLFVLHELPLMYHELSLIVLRILHQGADGSSGHVIPTLACAMAGIYGCGRIQQPCHPLVGMCDGMGSMAAAPMNLPILI